METMFKNMLLFNGLLLCYDLCYDFCWDVSRINVFCHGNDTIFHPIFFK